VTAARDFALAISADEEVDDVRLLVDIFRRNWTGSFHIVVCAASAGAAAEIGRCDVDSVAIGESVRLEADPREALQEHIAGALRAVDGIRKACGLAAGSSAPYTMHLAAGRYPLAWDPVRALGEGMRRRGAVLAARGQGFGLYAHDTPVGRFDPAFFVVDNAFARARRLWEFSLADFLPHKVSAPGFVALWALGRVGVHRFWRYAADDGGEGPIAFDPARGFLRVDASRLPPDLASRLVASYFAEYGVTRGPAIEAFHARWGADAAAARDEARAVGRGAGRRPGAWARGRAFLRERLVRRWIYRYRYGDMVWPRGLDDVYRAAFGGAGPAPAELRDVSFDMPSPRRSRAP